MTCAFLVFYTAISIIFIIITIIATYFLEGQMYITGCFVQWKKFHPDNSVFIIIFTYLVLFQSLSLYIYDRYGDTWFSSMFNSQNNYCLPNNFSSGSLNNLTRICMQKPVIEHQWEESVRKVGGKNQRNNVCCTPPSW